MSRGSHGFETGDPTPPMRILQVHTRYRQAGGEDLVVGAEAEALRRAGHELVRHECVNPEGALAAAGALSAAPWNARQAAAARRAAADADADVAHIHNTWFAMSPAVVAAVSGLGLPTVMTLHNYRLICANAQLLRAGRPCTDCVGGSSLPGVRHRCYRGSAAQSAVAAATIALHRRLGTWVHHVDRFIALSSFGRELFVAGGLPPDKVTVRYHSVPDPGERPHPPSRSERVVFVGRLSPEKGLDVVLDAWAQRPPTGLELVVIGDGPERASLESRGVAGVTFAGSLPRDEVFDVLLAARGLVFPSVWYEGLGLTLLEAMAAGLPVIASDLGAAAELVGDDEWGRLVPPGNRPGWADALAAWTDDAAVDQAGAAGRARYLDRHTVAAGTRSLEAIYVSVQELRGGVT